MESAVRIRRARREDFDKVRSLLGVHAPAARAERKRFRRLVSTLHEDLYLAEHEDDRALVGLAVIAYAHGLDAPTAVVRQLRGCSPEAASRLLDRACQRAAARGCAWIELRLEPTTGPTEQALPAALARDGWGAGPQTWVRAIPACS